MVVRSTLHSSLLQRGFEQEVVNKSLGLVARNDQFWFALPKKTERFHELAYGTEHWMNQMTRFSTRQIFGCIQSRKMWEWCKDTVSNPPRSAHSSIDWKRPFLSLCGGDINDFHAYLYELICLFRTNVASSFLKKRELLGQSLPYLLGGSFISSMNPSTA